jgi:hypothetical protein
MATSETQQARLGGDYEVLEYELGDLLEEHWSGRCRKVTLSECPLCATDPTRPRHQFGRHAKRADHFRTEH